MNSVGATRNSSPSSVMPDTHSARRKRKSDVAADNRAKPKVPHMDAITEPVPSSFLPSLMAIKQGFYLDSPNELVKFYQFCTTLDAKDPLGALMDILQLRLVGPFEVLHLGISSSVEPGRYVLCHRYFHDPPELVTLLTGPNNLHYGYFRYKHYLHTYLTLCRDTPTEKPAVVVKTEPSNGGELNLVAPTLFAAVKSVLSKKPTASAEVLLKKLCNFAKQNNIILDETGRGMTHSTPYAFLEKSERRARCVCPTLNGMGLVVKLREGDIGYRPLSVTDSKLSALLKAVATAQTEESQLAKLEAVDQLITYAQFACDEGDYGQSLELGLSLLAFRTKDIKPNQVTVFNSRIKHLLSVGYELAGCPEFSHVVREHMNDRRVDPIGMPWNSK
ncbi:hypothetical protein X801_04980 [Opisthorchis viverrini]|uniref:Uncharacterized protein n=1 Tax=Opisthorchis viverrini TaxID=6198 RepID=A0A1S8WY35_OPIVI|nr:hypothetical protein X801_04980 [Opisthorchis viverrini]